jgi:hypothetical protein
MSDDARVIAPAIARKTLQRQISSKVEPRIVTRFRRLDEAGRNGFVTPVTSEIRVPLSRRLTVDPPQPNGQRFFAVMSRRRRLPRHIPSEAVVD